MCPWICLSVSVLRPAGVEYILAEALQPLLSRIAEVLETKHILDAPEQRVVIVGCPRPRARLDEGRKQHRPDPSAARAGHARTVVGNLVGRTEHQHRARLDVRSARLAAAAGGVV